MQSDLLHVVAVISNPIRWQSRVTLFRNFITHMQESGVRLTVVECAFGDRPFDIADMPDVNMVRVRTNSLAWNKENLINLGIARLPQDWQYVAWIDGDVHLRQSQWAAEAVHALQQYPIVQPWSDCYDLGPFGEHMEHHRSFCRQFWNGRVTGIGKGYEFAHPGYAWAARRDTLDRMGGLLDVGVAGAGDHHMALAMIGHAEWSIPGGVTDGYRQSIMQWQERAAAHIRQNLGYLPGAIEHFWHGRKAQRKYIERWDILIRNKFDPATDLKKNTWGVVELAGNKPQLVADLDRYMRQRNEDSNSVD